MKNYRWNGSITAESSIVHGGRTLGTNTHLRREKFVLADGTVDEIPIISGNALRGVMRDVGAKMTWNALGCPQDLPLANVDVLWSGGSLVKAKGAPVTGQRLATVRKFLPHVAVFGAAGGGRIIEGSLSVGKMLPICAQTRHLLPADLAETATADMWDLLQIEEYSRFPRRQASIVAATATADDDGEASTETDDPDGLMRYGAETFIAGTRFHAWIALRNATDAEHDFLTALMAKFAFDAHVGGRTAAGHGRLRLDLTEERPDGDPGPTNWAQACTDDTAAATTALRWLG